MSLNRFQVIGRLTKDPELKQTPSGTHVVTLSIAQNKVWKDQQGAKQEKSLFFNLTAFGKQAETLAEYTKKGQLMHFETNIENQSREDGEGNKKYKTVFFIDKFEFLGGKKEENQDPNQDNWYQQEKQKQTKNKKEEEIRIEDIPF